MQTFDQAEKLVHVESVHARGESCERVRGVRAGDGALLSQQLEEIHRRSCEC